VVQFPEDELDFACIAGYGGLVRVGELAQGIRVEAASFGFRDEFGEAEGAAFPFKELVIEEEPPFGAHVAGGLGDGGDGAEAEGGNDGVREAGLGDEQGEGWGDSGFEEGHLADGGVPGVVPPDEGWVVDMGKEGIGDGKEFALLGGADAWGEQGMDDPGDVLAQAGRGMPVEPGMGGPAAEGFWEPVGGLFGWGEFLDAAGESVHKHEVTGPALPVEVIEVLHFEDIPGVPGNVHGDLRELGYGDSQWSMIPRAGEKTMFFAVSGSAVFMSAFSLPFSLPVFLSFLFPFLPGGRACFQKPLAFDPGCI